MGLLDKIPFPRSQGDFFRRLFSPTEGHDHDGTNSKPAALVGDDVVGTGALADDAVTTAKIDDAAVTADKLDGGVVIAALQASGVAHFTSVAHDDTSPVTIVPSDPAARQVLILGVASVAAVNDPDWNVGDASLATRFFTDIGGGTWDVDDVFVAAGTLTAGEDMIVTQVASGDAGTIDFLVLTFEA